jgi:UDP-N-acetylglucosamine acyltransferase
MTRQIHPLSVVDPTAVLGREVEVGPYAIINGETKIGDRTHIAPFVFIDRHTVIGDDCKISQGVVIGVPPLDKNYQGEPTGVRIGDRNIIREYTTVHRATGEGEVTVIGNDNFIMAYIHIAHNCRLGNGIVIANSCQLAGYVQVGDDANLGGMTGVHQFTRIGRLAMVGACSYLAQDIPPFFMGQGNPFRVVGVNLVGLRRQKFSADRIRPIQDAYKVVYRTRIGLSEAIIKINATIIQTEEIRELVRFLENSRRGLNIWKPAGERE